MNNFESGSGFKIPSVKNKKDVPLNECYDRIKEGLCNEVSPTECISKIVYHDFDPKSKVMGKSPLNIKYIMLPNIIFITYLQDIDDNDSGFNLLKKRQQMIRKMDKNNMNQSNTNNAKNNSKNNTNKKMDVKNFFSLNEDDISNELNKPKNDKLTEPEIQKMIKDIKERIRLREEEQRKLEERLVE